MKPKIRSEGDFRRWKTAACMVFIASVCVSCPKGKPFVPAITPQGIVSGYAQSAFDTWFDRKSTEDREALKRFFETTKHAETKADLTRAWAAIPELATEGHRNFLQEKIFDRAARDGDWPGSNPPLNQKAVYVDGVRQALNEFLETEE